MLFDGIKTDSLGNTYPAGHYMRAGFSLRWAGADGIVARCYSEWMDWKSYTEYMERTVELTLVELLQLDTERKVMIDNLKWETFLFGFRRFLDFGHSDFGIPLYA